jgi:hypothetical protein
MNPGAPLWDGNVLFDDSTAGAIAALGARSVRINFRIDGAGWWDEPALARYDPIVDSASGAGLEPLGLVAYEATPYGQDVWNDDGDGDGINDYVVVFADAAEALIRHFHASGSVRTWEIWNEPDCWGADTYRDDPLHAGCTYLLPRVYGHLLAEVYLRVRDLVDSGEVSLVSGGLLGHDIGGSWTDATGYMAEVYAEGPWDWLQENTGRRYPWDRFGYHFYINQSEPLDTGRLQAYLDAVRALQAEQWDGSPLWITEFGWATEGGFDPWTQADNLAAAIEVLAARDDVERAFWYKVRDVPEEPSSWGVLYSDWSWKPAAERYAALASTCETWAPVPKSGGGGDAMGLELVGACRAAPGPGAAPVWVAAVLALALMRGRRRER